MEGATHFMRVVNKWGNYVTGDLKPIDSLNLTINLSVFPTIAIWKIKPKERHSETYLKAIYGGIESIRDMEITCPPMEAIVKKHLS